MELKLSRLPELARGIAIAEVISRRSLRCSKRRVPLMTRRSLRFLNRRSQDGLCQPAVLKSACPGRPVPACAFLARVLRTALASLDRVLSKTAAASLRSYTKGSYKTYFTVCVLYAGGLSQILGHG